MLMLMPKKGGKGKGEGEKGEGHYHLAFFYANTSACKEECSHIPACVELAHCARSVYTKVY